MEDNEYRRLKGMSLSDIADEMDKSGLYPLKPLIQGKQRDERYPTFPDALREVERANPPERCLNCGKPGYYYPADEAFAPGHCYSEAGAREFQRISSTCEFCFDYIVREPDEDDEDDEYDPGLGDDDSKARLEQSMIDEEYAKDRFSDLLDDVPNEHDDRL